MDESLLGQVQLFASLPPAELRRLALSLRQIEISTGSILLHEGEHGDRFFLVLNGEIEIIKALGTSDERRLRLEGPGEFVGEMSLLNPDRTRTASVRARRPTRLMEMTRADLDGLLQRYPAVAYDLARVLSTRLQEADNTTIRDLHEKNAQLTEAYQNLQSVHAQLVEKEKLERELEVAREIQESMLPREMPRLPGFDFAARMVPAQAVGGDFFDFIPLGDARLGIVVGDVSGKGVPAALFMALTRSLLRAEATRGVQPVEVLDHVNQHLLEMNETGMFVTVLYGVLDRHTRQFAYIRAGHELPLVVDARAQLTTPELGIGQPLGVFDSPRFDEQAIALPPSSLLLVYTDGITEAMDVAGKLFGMGRLEVALQDIRQAPVETAADSLLQRVASYRGTAAQADDMTLVAVRSC